ncbi:MAG: monovalent cation/H(+) antiporter subunit G [Verrucomicrobiota bacterium]
MITFLVSFFVIAGACFGAIAALGVVRMPDIYCRMHAATKAGAFGTALLLIGLVIAMPSLRTAILSLMIVAFFYLTAPIAAHMIGRVALNRDVSIWKPKSLRQNKPSADKPQP